MAETVQSWEANGVAQGLKPYNPNDPFAAFYPVVMKRNAPQGVGNLASFLERGEANLRARGLIYYKKNPGDCGQGTAFSNSDLQALSLGSSAVSGTTSILGSVGVLSGAATAGIGLGVALGAQAIAGIFQHHSQAVEKEQDTICRVAGIWNQIIKYLDAQVISGALDPSDAVSIMENYALQAKSELDTILKTCNAACYYEGYINAFVDFAGIQYPQIAPQNAHAPLSPSNPALSPKASDSPLGAPLSPVKTLSSAATSRNPVQSSEQVNAALPAASGSSLRLILFGGVLVLVLFLLLQKG